jgi:two-component system OmpR family sensor kinase
VSARWSLRSRLTAAVLATTGIVLVVLAVLLYGIVRRTAWQQHDEALWSRAEALAAIAEHDDTGYEMALPPEPIGRPASYIEVWLPGGEVLARGAALRGGDLPKLAGPLGHEFADTTLPDGRHGRMIGLRFLPRDEATGPRAAPLAMVLAEGTEAVDDAVASMRTWFLVLGLAGLAAIAAVTAWSLHRGLRPLTDLATQIEAIDDRRLTTRLPSEGQPAELQAPIHKLNELLARLDASFTRERRFTGDVSHELRTPLAGLRTLLEVTALADRSPAAYAAAIASALVVVTQLGILVENLISLARLEAGQLPLVLESVDLRGLVDECWRPHASIASARALRFSNSLPATAIIETDREKLRIVLSNLLANAAEYTEAGGWIDVKSIAGGVLEVVDSGPVIPADQVALVFDRLWRGDAARTDTGAHCGIGLSLARALSESLSWSLTVSSTTAGVAFRLLGNQPRTTRS